MTDVANYIIHVMVIQLPSVLKMPLPVLFWQKSGEKSAILKTKASTNPEYNIQHKFLRKFSLR